MTRFYTLRTYKEVCCEMEKSSIITINIDKVDVIEDMCDGFSMLCLSNNIFYIVETAVITEIIRSHGE